MIMSPGVGFLYSGLLRRKNALSMIFLVRSLPLQPCHRCSSEMAGPGRLRRRDGAMVPVRLQSRVLCYRQCFHR